MTLTSRSGSKLLLGLTLLLSGVCDLSQAGGQESVIVNRESCSACTVQASHYTRLGDPNGPGMIPGLLRQVFRSSDGSFWLVTESEGPPLVYDSLGTFVRVAGGIGEGPNEFKRRLRVTEGPSGVHVLDAEQARGMVQALDGRLVRSYRLALANPSDAVVLPSRMLITADAFRTRELVGYPVHVFDSVGRHVRSFGGSASRADTPVLSDRRLVVSPRGGFWSAHIATPRYVRWDEAGQVLQIVNRRDAAWYYSDGTYGPLTPDQRPGVRTIGVRESDGLLWTVTIVADDNWAAAFAPPRTNPDGSVRYPVKDEDQLMDTVVEVIDLESGTVLATARMDQYFPVFTGGFLTTHEKLTSELGVVVDVWRLSLSR